MGKIHFVSGGTRSGKSEYAEEIANSYGSVYYLATARIQSDDPEMLSRISLHQERRPDSWQTIEEPVDIAGALAKISKEAESGLDSCVLFESVGTFLLNIMMEEKIDWDQADRKYRHDFESRTLGLLEGWLDILSASDHLDMIFVSEEVGLSLISTYAMSRIFTDVLGKINQRIAAVSDTAALIVSGLPLRLK